MHGRRQAHFPQIVGALLLSALSFTPAWAQSNASIIGRVVDDSGASMPGVTVTAASPALQVPSVSVVTEADGGYRISPLPIGTYTVTYELTGFDTVRRTDIRLTVGFVAKIDIGLKVGSVSETVVVSGASPVVDTVSTSGTTQLTREQLENIPGSKNGLISLLAATPGVRTTKEVGGSSTNQQPTFRAFGQSGEAWNLIEGVFTNAPQAGGGAGNYFDFNTFDESAISTLGNPAKTPTRGIQIVSVVKSGGNELHGSGGFGEYLTDLQPSNIDDALRAQGVTSGNPTKVRYDRSGDLGGKVVRDKLWFYGSTRRRHDIRQIAGAVQPSGDPMLDDQLTWWHTEKLSYQLNASNKLIAFHQWTHKWDSSGADTLVAWETRQEQNTNLGVGKLEWQGTKGSSMMFNLQAGYWQYYAKRYGTDKGPYPTTTLPGVSMLDSVTQKEWGENTGVGVRTRQGRQHTRGSISWYRPDSFAGNHTLETGFDFLNQYASRGNVGRNQPPYQLEYQNGVPFQLRTQNIPVTPYQSDHYLGIYAQDTWTMARRLTLNLGVRAARDNAFVPENCRGAAMFAPAQCWDKIPMNVWTTVAPRLHTAFDITGNGRSVVKFGWGRFVHMRSLEPEAQGIDPKATQTTIWRWSDRNGDRLYQPGEVNLDFNGPDYVSGAPGTTTVANPDDQPPLVDEFSGSFERQLATNLALRVTTIYSRNGNTLRLTNLRRPASSYSIPITRPDPGPDGTNNTGDEPGTSLTYFQFPATLAGAAFDQFTRINDSRADASYKSIEVAAAKRMSRGHQFSASYSATKIDGELGATNAFGPADNPNAEINVAAHYWEWQAKLSGSYRLGWGVQTSANYEIRSGDPWARTVRVTGGTTIPNFTMPVEAIGTRRLPQYRLLDMRVQKTLDLWKRARMEVQLNVFNVLNSNMVQAVQQRSSSTFGFPIADGLGSTILPPRIVEIGATFRF